MQKEVKKRGEGERRWAFSIRRGEDAASTVARYKNHTPLSTSTSPSTFFKRPPLSTYFLDLLSLSLLLLSLPAFAATCTYDGAWDTTPSAETDEIVISSGTLTWGSALPQTVASWTQNGGTVTFKTGRSDNSSTIGVVSGDERVFKITGDVTVNAGTITHNAQPSMDSSSAGWKDGKGVYRLILEIGGNLTVAAGASISATGKGFLNGQKGPGACNRGGCHGGSGGDNSGDSNNSLVNKGKMYGSVKSPKTLGSTGSGGMDGGGSIQLAVTGDATVDGTLEANGASGSWYGAAGGSVLLVAKSLTGASTGTIAARGSGSSVCGSGGRISLKLTGTGKTFDTFEGTISAQPLYFSSSKVHPGTIYLETAADAGKGVLLVKGMGTPTTTWGRGTSLETAGDDCDFSKIVLTNGAHLVICSNVTVRTAAIEAYGTGAHSIALAGGTLVVPDGHVFAKHQLRCFYNGSVLSPKTEGSALSLASGVTLTCDRELTVPGDLTLQSGSTITHSGANDSYTGHRVYIICTNLTVNSGAAINVNGMGFTAQHGDGRPITTGKTSRGGSHGGLGADVGEAKCYGSIVNPNTYGSGGESRAGGGIIRLIVRDTLTNNGTIASRGETAAPWGYVGAGGSVYISAGKLAGAKGASINANAGTSDRDMGSGGGRVAVTLTKSGSSFSDYLGTITAYGGVLNNGGNVRTQSGAPGTVYLRKPGEGEHEGTLIIDNGNYKTSYYTTDISSLVTDAEVGHVILTNRAILRVRQNSTLTVHGDFANGVKEKLYVNGETGDAENAAGAVVFTDASRTSTISGTNTFAAFTCTTPGKTLQFGTAPGSLTSVTGAFTIAGAEGSVVRLAPSVSGVDWLLDMLEGAKASVSYTDVTHSDASGGSTISAEDTTTVTDCKNWIVSQPVKPGDPIRWTGEESSVWTVPGNWDPQRAPIETDVVTIGAGAKHQATLAENMTFNRMVVEAGAFLELNTYSMSVTNGLVVNGTLIASGGETVTAAVEARFAAVNGAPSLTLAGDNVAFAPNGNAFDAVSFANAGNVTVTGSFAADTLVCHRSSAAALTFSAGSALTLREVDFLGVDGDGNAALTLGSSGGTWSLDVSGKASVRGVIVSNATAHGLKIHAEAPSTDNGGNDANWIFGESYAAWCGPSGGDWNEPTNWTGGVVPDATARIFFDASATVSLTNAVSVRELDVAAAVKISGSGGSLAASEAIEIQSGGTLTADVPLASGGVCYVRSGGTITHAANPGSTDTGVKLALTVAGDMLVESDGSVSATGKGFLGGRGPGTSVNTWGATHGGNLEDVDASCYGSVFAPATLGSGGTEVDSAKRGGGRIALSVRGTLTVNGTIAGYDFRMVRDRFFGTGKRYLTFGPSKKSMKRVREKIHGITHARNGLLTVEKVVRFLNRKSQRRYRLKFADSYYGGLNHYGMYWLKWADVRRRAY